MGSATLIEKRRKAANDIPPVEEILRGSLVMVKRYCGKAKCRCLKGFKHRSLYVSQSNKGESRLVYIPQRSEKEVRRLIRNYQTLKSVMEEISRINMRLVTERGGGRK
jgi:hypothetical protein